MAEGGTLSQSVLGASEEIYDYNCSPCEEAGVYKEAHKYCDNCKLYYCKKCLGDHNKFPALRGHLIKEWTSQPKDAALTGVSGGVSVPAPTTEPCENHPEEMIKMYCGEHDLLCCTVCIALDHRECKNVHYILKLAKDIRTSQEYIDYVEEMKRLKTAYEETKQSIQEEIMTMSNVKTEIIREIKEYKRELVLKIEELEKKSIENVNERYKQITERMIATANHVDELLDKVRHLLREMDVTSEAQAFVNMKKMSLTKGEKDKIDKGIQHFEGLSFSLDRNIRNALDNADGLAAINFPFKIISRKEYDIKFYDDDYSHFDVRDMSILDDDTVVMTCDDKLKRFSRSFVKLKNVSVPGQLWGICKTSRLRELAVAIRDKQKVQFVQYKAKSMSLTKSFVVEVPCKGICCKDGNLFVTCGGGDNDNVQGHVRKYDMKGNLICTIDTDNAGRRIFLSPRLMTLDSRTNDIYIADSLNGIIVLDRNEKITSHPYNSFLKYCFGISITTRNDIFVSGYDSCSIQQYDENFRYVGTILNFTDEISKPLCIHSDESKKKLIVSFQKHNHVYVYDFEC